MIGKSFFKEIFGFNYIHPIYREMKRRDIAPRDYHTVSETKELGGGYGIAMVSEIIDRETKTTNSKFKIVVLEDGSAEEDRLKLYLWNNQYDKFKSVLDSSKFVFYHVKRTSVKYDTYAPSGFISLIDLSKVGMFNEKKKYLVTERNKRIAGLRRTDGVLKNIKEAKDVKESTEFTCFGYLTEINHFEKVVRITLGDDNGFD